MKLKGFSVLDVKVGSYAQPFFAPAVGLAVRMFGDWCVDPQTPLAKHPGDYMLFEVGEFDDEGGFFVSLDKPRLISSGSDHVAVTRPREVRND